MLSNNEIINILELSFKPLRCAAEIWDYNEKIRIRIFDKDDNPVLSLPERKISNLRNQNALTELIDVVREKLARQGLRLN